MKPALHRSITFWAGILVMAFLCWAWRDSMSWLSSYSRNGCALVSGDSCIALDQSEAGNDSGLDRLKWKGGKHERSAFPRPRFERGADRHPLADVIGATLAGETNPDLETIIRSDGPLDTYFGILRYQPVTDWRLSIPYWLLLLAVAISWGVLLLMRGRRRKRTGTALPVG